MNKKIKLAICAGTILFLFIILSACNNTNNKDVATDTKKSNDIICNIEQFANITSSELVSLLGNPDNIEKSNTNGFAKFPCVYYEYNSAKELGEVSFILINDTVVKFVSYNDFAYNKGSKILESFNITMDKSCSQDNTSTYARYRCPTKKIDDLWINNINQKTDTFGTLQVTYDMYYFEEWYIPITDVVEESNYQWWTQEAVKELLKSPKSADFPNILDWTIVKNNFYVLVSSYVDAKNSFGAEIRNKFTFIYKVDTQNIVYAIFDGEVIINNGYVETEKLVAELVDEKRTESTAKNETTTNISKSQNEEKTTRSIPQVKDTTEEITQSIGTNDINDLKYIINNVCSSYNSGDTALNGHLVGTVESSTSVTIEHVVGDLIFSDTLYVIYQMEDKLLELFSDTLNEEFPEQIDVYVYTTYDYVDCTKEEYEASWEVEPEYQVDSFLDGIAM